MKPIVLSLKTETRQNLNILSSATGRSQSELVAEAVDIYVQEQLKLIVEEHRREGRGPKPGVYHKKI